MLAPCTSWHAMHRELSGKAGQLDTRDRGRLTTIARKPGPPTAKDIRWLETKYTEANMAKIDDTTAIELFKARQQVRKLEANVEAVGDDYKAAKKLRDDAQAKVDALLDELNSTGLFNQA